MPTITTMPMAIMLMTTMPMATAATMLMTTVATAATMLMTTVATAAIMPIATLEMAGTSRARANKNLLLRPFRALLANDTRLPQARTLGMGGNVPGRGNPRPTQYGMA